MVWRQTRQDSLHLRCLKNYNCPLRTGRAIKIWQYAVTEYLLKFELKFRDRESAYEISLRETEEVQAALWKRQKIKVGCCQALKKGLDPKLPQYIFRLFCKKKICVINFSWRRATIRITPKIGHLNLRMLPP